MARRFEAFDLDTHAVSGHDRAIQRVRTYKTTRLDLLGGD